jgi:hypothetical protein
VWTIPYESLLLDRSIPRRFAGGMDWSWYWRFVCWLEAASDETVLRTNGLDGFFFLRYLRKAQLICFIGCCMTWPVLFPVNATGGGISEGLDILSMSNIGKSDSQKNR